MRFRLTRRSDCQNTGFRRAQRTSHVRSFRRPPCSLQNRNGIFVRKRRRFSRLGRPLIDKSPSPKKDSRPHRRDAAVTRAKLFPTSTEGVYPQILFRPINRRAVHAGKVGIERAVSSAFPDSSRSQRGFFEQFVLNGAFFFFFVANRPRKLILQSSSQKQKRFSDQPPSLRYGKT